MNEFEWLTLDRLGRGLMVFGFVGLLWLMNYLAEIRVQRLTDLLGDAVLSLAEIEKRLGGTLDVQKVVPKTEYPYPSRWEETE